jgi:hypothetical protein
MSPDDDGVTAIIHEPFNGATPGGSARVPSKFGWVERDPSPWDSGNDVEKKYARALGEAQSKVRGRDLAWYFLWSVNWGQPRKLSIEYQDAIEWVSCSDRAQRLVKGQSMLSVPSDRGHASA